MQRSIEKLQYITHQSPSFSHEELVLQACKVDIKWIQVRMKNTPEDEWLATAQLARQYTREHNARLIINDHVEIAKAVGADGVHLGKTDRSPTEARKILGENYIIGGTANTFEDVQQLVAQGVDYIGIGPFRFTTTKKNLSPILGLEGYKKLVQSCQETGIDIPLIAIGGIQVEDVREILETGMYGIAVASAIGYGDLAVNATKFMAVINDER